MEQKYYRFEQSRMTGLNNANFLYQEATKEKDKSQKLGITKPHVFPNGFTIYNEVPKKEPSTTASSKQSSQSINKENYNPLQKGLVCNGSHDAKLALSELEEKLFGIYRPQSQEQHITEKDWVPLKTGTGQKFLRHGPKHIYNSDQFEPLYVPQENILEESLRREAERVAYQENLSHKIVYDCYEADPRKSGGGDEPLKDLVDALGDS